MNADNPDAGAGPVHRRFVQYVRYDPAVVGRILLGVFVWLCFTKLPATGFWAGSPQSYEAVFAFAAAHRLQWGQDIIFTYGPLAFLFSDYYWGSFFWPILLWAFGFSLLLTLLFLRFSERVVLPIRAALYVALPLLSLLPSGDPICFLAIGLIGIAACPEERTGVPLLVVSGLALAILSLIKFTFCLYSLFTLLVLAVVYCLGRHPRSIAVLLASSLVSLLAAWLLAGQQISNFPRYFQRGWEIASGYQSAMAFPATGWNHVLGIAILLCLIALGCLQWRSSEQSLPQAGRLCVVGAGLFLAWKEGFIRADSHIILFLVYAIFVAALMPALLRVPAKTQRKLLPLTIAGLLLSLAPFAMAPSLLPSSAGARFIHKRSDTMSALFTPGAFRRSLERQLDTMRSAVLLPRIRAELGNAPVAVLFYDQDVALLNGFNYRPHPVFQSYSCYTPELQRLNSGFFDSDKVPSYVLWRPGTIDYRFPGLDEGKILLRILSSYSPGIQEGGFVLWKRHTPGGKGYSLDGPTETMGVLDQWVPLPDQPTWLQIELHETWAGAIQRFLYQASVPWLDVQLEDGQAIRYRLPVGNAQAGFMVNPLLQSDAALLNLFAKPRAAIRVVAVSVHSDCSFNFHKAVRFTTREIKGVSALEGGKSAKERRSPSA